MYGDHIWDEDQWEAFLQEHDKRVSRYMDLLHSFMSRYPPPDEHDQAARRSWEEALKAYLLRKGLHPEDPVLSFVFSDTDQAESDETEDQPEPVDASLFGEMEEDITAEQDEFDPEELHRLPAYQQALDLATDVLRWSDALPSAEKVKDSALVHYCSCLTQIPGNLAKGHALGYEHEMLGGNIACVKRALNEANAALELLHEIKQQPYLRGEQTYLHFYERTFELRNLLGLYVQDLRHRFELGID